MVSKEAKCSVKRKRGYTELPTTGCKNFWGWPVCLLRAMAYRSICVALLLFLIGHMLAVPERDPVNRNTHIAPCQEHSKLNDRLDAVEKRVEETVQKLEAELAVLLDTIQAHQAIQRKKACTVSLPATPILLL
ncbi:hypothetical protein AMELA_G00052680 [Ameiurus melas]|uniref:Uncharacterized protein n=1 Tax=Ameiurus melas TaxID=219545 RepID=A0A7J6B7N9_AMEME|nr:hypothetical protein AMELA_G00052680 [Ameiurus melas]